MSLRKLYIMLDFQSHGWCTYNFSQFCLHHLWGQSESMSWPNADIGCIVGVVLATRISKSITSQRRVPLLTPKMTSKMMSGQITAYLEFWSD